MNPKAQYISRIRTQTSYPVFRAVVNVIAIIYYVLGGLCVFGGLIQILDNDPSGLVSIVVGPLFAVCGKLLKEAATMIADAVDSITDLNSRYE